MNWYVCFFLKVSAIEIDTDEQWERISISMLFFGMVLTINCSVLIAFLEVSYNTLLIMKEVEYIEAKMKGGNDTALGWHGIDVLQINKELE